MKTNTKTQNAVTTVEALGIFTRKQCSRRGVVLALAFAGATVSLGMAKTAQADNVVLYASSFEQPTFKSGDLLLGPDGWSPAIPPFLNPAGARITDTAASNRKQSVDIHGGDLIGSGGITAPYDAVGSYRRPLDYEITADQSRVHIDGDLLLETDQPETPGQFFSHTIAARSGDGETLGEIGLTSAGEVEAYDFNAAPGADPAFSEPVSLNQWHRVTMLLDYENRTTSYYIDGHFIGIVDAPSASNGLSRVATVVYARPDGDEETGGPGSVRSDYTARFDNFRVKVTSANE